MNGKLFPKAGGTLLMLCGGVLVALTGCVRYVERPRAGNVYVEPVVQVEPVFVEQDDYVYYPRYGMYYGSRSHRYFYQEGRSWVARPAPRGVSVGVLFSSPSVTVDFHDRPAAHHAQVIRTYPRNWRPPGGNNGHRQGPGDDPRERQRR